MLKINLLPREVRDRRLVPVYIVVCGVIFAAVALGVGFVAVSIGSQISRLNVEVQQLAQEASQVKALETEISTWQQQESLAASRIQFIQAVQNTGPAWADYIGKLSQWVPASALLDSWTISKNKLDWKGRLQIEDPSRGLTSNEYMKFYINLLRCPMFSGISLKMEGLNNSYSFGGGAQRITSAPTPPAGAASKAPTSAYAAAQPLREFADFTITATLNSPPPSPAFSPGQLAAAAAATAAAKAAATAGVVEEEPSSAKAGQEEKAAPASSKSTGSKGIAAELAE